jgi:hypothetical protein
VLPDSRKTGAKIHAAIDLDHGDVGKPMATGRLPDFRDCTLQHGHLQLLPGVWDISSRSSVPTWPWSTWKNPLAPPPLLPINFTPGSNVDGSFLRSRCGPAGCPPFEPIRSRSQSLLRLVCPGIQPSGHPRTAKYDDGTTWAMTPIGLLSASPATRLAALSPYGPQPDNSYQQAIVAKDVGSYCISPLRGETDVTSGMPSCGGR